MKWGEQTETDFVRGALMPWGRGRGVSFLHRAAQSNSYEFICIENSVHKSTLYVMATVSECGFLTSLFINLLIRYLEYCILLFDTSGDRWRCTGDLFVLKIHDIKTLYILALSFTNTVYILALSFMNTVFWVLYIIPSDGGSFLPFEIVNFNNVFSIVYYSLICIILHFYRYRVGELFYTEYCLLNSFLLFIFVYIEYLDTFMGLDFLISVVQDFLYFFFGTWLSTVCPWSGKAMTFISRASFSTVTFKGRDSDRYYCYCTFSEGHDLGRYWDGIVDV